MCNQIFHPLKALVEQLLYEARYDSEPFQRSFRVQYAADRQPTANSANAGVVPQAFFTPRPEAGPSGDTPADRVAEAVMSRKSDNAFPRRFTIQEEARTQLGRAWQGYLRCGPT